MKVLVSVIPMFVVFPLAGAFLTSLFGRRFKRLPDFIGVLCAAVTFCSSLFVLKLLGPAGGTIVYSMGSWKPPVGIDMVIDGFSSLMLVVVNFVAFLITVYSVSYMQKYTAKWKFFTLFLLMVAGMNGVVATGDIFNLFVFLEIASISSYALVAFGTEKEELEAAFKYAVMGTLGSLFLLLGIVFLYSFTSTLNMADMALILYQKGANNVVLLVTIFFIMGFGLKSALVPFHGWLPDAHPAAPAPVSATLSGVLIKSLGVYTLFRIFYNVLGASQEVLSIIMALGVLSMVVGAFLAVGQWDFKRLLAYSSISQIGYIVLGISLGTPLGILGGLFHLFNHSIMKSLLFLTSGGVEYATGTRDIRNMGGLVNKMPVTGATYVIGSMSISGVPPFSGFWSKLIIIIAAVQAGRYWYAFWAVIASLLTLAALMKVAKYAFWGTLKEKYKAIKEVPLFMRLSMEILAFMCVIGGFFLIPEIRSVLFDKAVSVISGGLTYSISVLGYIK